jgi:membrane protease YdiL (CAAX protease family)
MTQRRAPTIVGLLLVWGGAVLLVSPAATPAMDSSSVSGALLAQVAMWVLFVAVVGIVIFWEQQPPESLWLKPLQWQTFAWASLLALFSIVVLFPLTEWVRTTVGLPDYAIGMETTLASPIWLRVVAVLTAGIVEESLFRGFTVTRLLRLGWSVPIVIAVSSAGFAALHLPVWGSGPSLAFFVGGLATTTFFVWRRDLLAMILAHIAIDTWALVITPAVSRWWE